MPGKNRKNQIGFVCAIVLMIALFISARHSAGLIPDVQREIRTTPSPTPVYGNVMKETRDPAAETPFPVLGSGSSGIQVLEIQKRLLELKYPIYLVDGQYGSETIQAVMLFQEANQLETDGIVGIQTYTRLMSSQAREYTPPTETPVVTVTPQPTETQTPVPEKSKGYITEDGFPLLVNREHPLPDSYQTYDLVCMNDVCPTEIVKIKYQDTYAEREAVEALLQMLQEAVNQGIDSWQISAAYRTVDQQQYLFDRQVRAYMQDNNLSRTKAIQATRKTVADPGTSEHHTGVCFDITVPGKSFGGTVQAEWLKEHCWDYGFILRYNKDKESITGFLAEPWHFRYVGIEHAKIMQDENLCLEEYLEEYTKDIMV